MYHIHILYACLNSIARIAFVSDFGKGDVTKYSSPSQLKSGKEEIWRMPSITLSAIFAPDKKFAVVDFPVPVLPTKRTMSLPLITSDDIQRQIFIKLQY